MKCILHLTDHEYDRVLQVTHDAVAWDTADQYVLKRIDDLLGWEVGSAVRSFDECRIEKHDTVSEMERIEPVPELLENTRFVAQSPARQRHEWSNDAVTVARC